MRCASQGRQIAAYHTPVPHHECRKRTNRLTMTLTANRLAPHLAPTALILWKFVLLDCARVLIRERYASPPLLLLAGWLGGSLLLIALALILPISPLATWILAAASVITLQWAWIAGGLHASSPARSDLMSLPVFRALIQNVLIGIWWISVATELPPLPQIQMPVTCALLASSLGLPATTFAWVHLLSAAQRNYWNARVAILCVLTLAALWWITPIESWRTHCMTLVILAVVAHRHASMMLSRRQQEVRFGTMLVLFIAFIFASVHLAEQFSSRGLAASGLGMLFAGTTLICTAMTAWNEWRGNPAAHRDDPIHESMRW